MDWPQLDVHLLHHQHRDQQDADGALREAHCRDGAEGGELQVQAHGAQQCHRGPRLAVLDEAMSGVSEDLETKLNTEARGRGVTPVSVGHRGSFRQHHHNMIFAISEDGERA